MSGNPFEELRDLAEADAPTLRGAAEAICKGLREFINAKGRMRPRPMSWAKRTARDHFGWSRIGSKKFEQILEIGYSEGWFEKTERGQLLGSTVSEGASQQTNVAELGAEMGTKTGKSKSTFVDMAPFYRQGGTLGHWKVLTEDDWDGKTYTLVRAPWEKADAKERWVPSWEAGRVLYELYDQRVREDIASGRAKTYCTSCKSELSRGCVYPDSHGRYACSGCNDLLHPDLVKPEGWVPPAHKPAEIKPVSKPAKIPKNESHSVSGIKTPKTSLSKLGKSIAKDGTADLMDAEAAINAS